MFKSNRYSIFNSNSRININKIITNIMLNIIVLYYGYYEFFISCNVIFVRLGTIKQRFFKMFFIPATTATSSSSSRTLLLIHNVTTAGFVAGWAVASVAWCGSSQLGSVMSQSGSTLSLTPINSAPLSLVRHKPRRLLIGPTQSKKRSYWLLAIVGTKRRSYWWIIITF